MSLELVFFITAVVFTAVGWYFGFKTNSAQTVSHTIDVLIKEGYIKTRTNAHGGIELVKVVNK